MSRQIPPPIAEAVAALVSRYIPDLTSRRVIELLSDCPTEVLPRQIPTALTKSEVCQATRLSLPTVNRLMKSGRLPYTKIGRAVRIPLSALEQLFDEEPLTDTSTRPTCRL